MIFRKIVDAEILFQISPRLAHQVSAKKLRQSGEKKHFWRKICLTRQRKCAFLG
ncbi:hypothetical protein [Maricaulis virginensis]|uniref:hypothetical protein n=1 Tax=Maricaulis virginensis TaxID=144022 RepID=UPI0022F28145|nr:hypothetical protein [Maricaulis virginensis]